MNQSARPKQVLTPERDNRFKIQMETGLHCLHAYFDPSHEENPLNEAANAFSMALEEKPFDPAALIALGETYYWQANYSQARVTFQKALDLNATQICPRNKQSLSKAHQYLGLIACSDQSLEQGKLHLTRAIRMAGLQSAQTRWVYAFCLKEWIQHNPQQGWFKQAAFFFTLGYAFLSGLVLLPFQPDVPFLLHRILVVGAVLPLWLFGTEQDILQKYHDLRQKWPGSNVLALLLGMSYKKTGRYEHARFWLESFLSRHPGNLEAHFQIAELFEDQLDYPAMTKAYQAIIPLQPHNSYVWSGLGTAAYYAHNYPEALRAYQTALQLNSDAKWKAMLAQNMANLYMDCFQNQEAAIGYYELARSWNPQDIENYIQLGILHFQAGDYLNAEQVYLQACRVAPMNARLYSNLGYLRWREQDLERAIQYYEKAIALDTGYEIPMNNLGVIYLDALGQAAKSAELFERALAVNPRYALAYYNLGRAYSLLERRLEAAESFQAAQEINEVSHELDPDELVARIHHLFEMKSEL